MPSSQPDTIYGKWRGRIINKPSPEGTLHYTDLYDIVIQPEHPLAVGREVKIYALSMEAYHVPTYPPPLPIRYDIYDPRIEGRIIRVRALEGDTVEFAVENRTEGAAVSLAYIAVQYIPNITAKLDVVERAFRWLTKDQPCTRYIPLENAIIVRTEVETTHGPDRGPTRPARRESRPRNLAEYRNGGHGAPRLSLTWLEEARREGLGVMSSLEM